MPKSRSQKETFYKDEQAAKEGLGGNPETGQHGYSRSPDTGLMFKLPGHPTMNLAVEEDRRTVAPSGDNPGHPGGRVVQRGVGMASYPDGDPRQQMSSEGAPRDLDISGAIYESDTQRAISQGKAPRTAAKRRK